MPILIGQGSDYQSWRIWDYCTRKESAGRTINVNKRCKISKQSTILSIDSMVNDDNKMEMALNPSRLEYLMSLYNFSKDDIAKQMSNKRRHVTGADLAKMMEKRRIPLPILKKLDAKYKKGLNWYATDRKPPESKSSSIFFRKDKFNSVLNFEARRIASKFEERKFEIQYLCSAINFSL